MMKCRCWSPKRRRNPLGIGKHTKSPALEKRQGRGTPNVKTETVRRNHNSEWTMRVVLRVWRRFDTRAEQRPGHPPRDKLAYSLNGFLSPASSGLAASEAKKSQNRLKDLRTRQTQWCAKSMDTAMSHAAAAISQK